MKKEKKRKAETIICRIAAELLLLVFLAGRGTTFVLYAENAAELTGSYVFTKGYGDAEARMGRADAAGVNVTEGQILILPQGQPPATGDTVPLIGMLFLAFCSLFLGVMEILRKIRF